MNKIFDRLTQTQIIQRQELLARIFVDLDSIDTRKNILRNAGINEHFIARIDFNLNINELITNLVAKLKSHRISNQNLNDHPLIKLLEYIVLRSQKYNLESTEKGLCQDIINISQEKGNSTFNFNPEKSSSANQTSLKSNDTYMTTDSNYQYDVFISYSSKDRPWVKQLLQKLEAENLKACIRPLQNRK